MPSSVQPRSRSIDWRGVRNATFIVLGVVTMVTSTLLLFALILEDVYGSWVLDQPLTRLAIDGEQPTIGIVESNTRRLWSKKRADEYVEGWTDLLEGNEIPYRILKPDPHRGFEDIDEVDVLLVLTPQGLTGAERQVIQRKVSEGYGGIFSISSNMNEDEGILLHGGFWRELLKADEARVYEFERPGQVPFSGNLPFGGAVEPGEGIYFEKGMKAVTLSRALREPTSLEASLWDSLGKKTKDHAPDTEAPKSTNEFVGDVDPMLQPQPPRVERVEVRWGSFNRGRWVVLGFDPAGIPANSPSRSQVSRMLVSVVRWVMGNPMMRLQPWPDGKRVAVTVAVDLVGRANPPASLDRKLQQLGVRPTYFYGNPLQEDKDGRAIPMIGPWGEVATRGTERGPVAGRSLEDQTSELSRAQHNLRTRARTKREMEGDEPPEQSAVRGFMPPGEVYDDTTLRALVDAGYGYMFSRLDVPIAVPVTRRVDVPIVDVPLLRYWTSPKSVVLIPRTIPDDLGMYLDTGDSSAQAVADRYIEEFREFSDLGGLFTITLHADFFDQPGALGVFEKMIEDIEAPDVWFASADEIADWWMRRGNVVATLDVGPPHRLILRLSNVGEQDASDIVLRVQLPEVTGQMKLQLAHWRETDIADFKVQYRQGYQSADVVVRNLPAGSHEILYLDWR